MEIATAIRIIERYWNELEVGSVLYEQILHELQFNTSGILPVEYKVVIKPDEQAEKTGRQNLIFVPDHTRDRLTIAKQEGYLLASGGNAFEEWNPPRPIISDRIYFAMYAGIRFRNPRDDQYYILCNDKDIAGIIFEPIEKDTTKPQSDLGREVN